MKDILVLVTLQSLMCAIQKSIAEEELSRVDVRYCKNLNGIMEFIDKKISNSIEIIITTPGPSFFISRLLKRKLPILSLEYNNIDIIKALQLALSVCPGNVAFGHYLQETPWLDDIREMTGQGFDNFLFGNDDGTNIRTLKKLQARGIRAIVGGGYICNIAQERGLFAFPVEVNRFTIKETIRKAFSIADTQKDARYSQKNMDIILSNQAEAVITVDQDNEIHFFNKSAEKLFAVSGASVIGKHSVKVFPQNAFESVLRHGESIDTSPHTVHGVDIVGNYRPVFDNGSVIGAVGTFSTVTDIQKKDEFIRKYYAPQTAQAKHSFDDFYGSDGPFQELLERARCFARTDETILITGESGTGKEVMAGSIHNASRRRSKPFLSINSAAIPATLMESELFGYEPGAFTGGKKNGSPGMFEFAHGGTLFLDEIGEMPLDLQSKLLRVIQEKEVRRIGASRVIPVDVRIIAATNKNLNAEAAANRFRADLYYRLNILHLHMPPLREYAEGAGEIAEKILRKLNPEPDQASTDHLHALLAKVDSYRWPGNLRELENIVRRYLALRPYLSRNIKLSDIFESSEWEEAPCIPSDPEHTDAFQKLLATYYRLGCNKTLTAQELGISRSTLWRKLKQAKVSPR
uniref:sigma 54-interacting transcriptional regulator n=1 Tax=uncultured Bilophila sp. TaxID=529385 RepID=UPI0025E8A47B|nr:sigma 54-interacting transcriptional regulator [uncultured Bilophila sp.]